MSADVWFKRDVANVLLSNVQAMMNAMAASGSPNAAYVAGYRAAIGSIALAFGISPEQVLPEEPPLSPPVDGGRFGYRRLVG